MPRKTSAAAGSAKGGRSSSTQHAPTNAIKSTTTSTNTPIVPAGIIVSCDIPTVQYLKHLNETVYSNNPFIIEELDATHVLVKRKARNLVFQKIQAWQSSNVFTSLDTGAENLDVS